MNVEKKPGSGLTFGHDLDKKPGSGLTFGHGPDIRAVGTGWHRAMLMLGRHR